MMEEEEDRSVPLVDQEWISHAHLRTLMIRFVIPAFVALSLAAASGLAAVVYAAQKADRAICLQRVDARTDVRLVLHAIVASLPRSASADQIDLIIDQVLKPYDPQDCPKVFLS